MNLNLNGGYMLDKLGRALAPYMFVLARLQREHLYTLVAREARRTARR